MSDSKISFDKILEITRAKKSGDSWVGHCPAHDDANPSLSLTLASSGKVLMKCHAGCNFEDIKQSIRTHYWTANQSAKNYESVRLIDSNSTKFLTQDRKISANIIEWAHLKNIEDHIAIPIFDLNGLQIDTRRYLEPYKRKTNQPKIKGMPGASASLYPLPLINKLITGENLDHLGNLEKTYLVLGEGELDSLAGLSNGLLTVTNTCGAGTWKDEFSECLKLTNLPIVILMDNDEPGRKGALLRYNSLKAVGVDVSIAEWPNDRPAGHDLIDELRLHGKNNISNILKNATSYKAVIKLSDVKSENIDWIFEPYIASRKITILEGDPGVGKSFLALFYAAKLSNLKEKTLLVSLEDGIADTIRPRLDKFECNLDFILSPRESLPLDESGIKTLETILREEKPTLTILDTLTAVSAGRDNNKSNEMRPFLTELMKLAEKFNVGFLILRHLNKKTDSGEQYRGSGSIDITGAARSVIQVTQDREDKTLCRVNHIKSNLAPKAPQFAYRIENGTLKIVSDVPKEAPLSEIDRAVQFLSQELLEQPQEAVLMGHKAKELGFSESTIVRARKEVGVKCRKISENGRTFWIWSLNN